MAAQRGVGVSSVAGRGLEVARGEGLARGRDYLDVTRSGFLVRGGRRHSLSPR